MTDSRPGRWIDAEDLSARSRRGSVSAAEQNGLDRALEASQTLAAAHRLGLEFDRVTTVCAGDEQLILRLVESTLKASTRSSGGARRRWLLLGLAATLAFSGTALAWHQLRRERERPIASSVAPGSTRRTAPTSVRPVVEPTPLPTETPGVRSSPAPLEVASVEPHKPASESARLDGPAESAAPDAAALFREANAARHDADLAGARSLYLRLEREFPEAYESQLSHVSFGRVLLAMGRPAEAERQFALYLRSGGTLSEEAIVGRARSLAELGRAAEERKLWAALLSEFPSSVYT
ncbi:MAG TPA: hypothetical protein VGM29_19835, partial [Polyangiaceae bacterium]